MLKRLQPIDKIAIALIFALSFFIAIIVLGGQACGAGCLFSMNPRVREFSWQNREVGAQDQAFILDFDRPMERESVEQNLAIAPVIPGKISWAGRRLAYTLESPAPYGENYKVTLAGAREHFRAQKESGREIRPFFGQFRSRDRVFAYIGTQAEERGRLILENLTKDKKVILTPADLVVMDFKFYPNGDRVLFSAAPKNLDGNSLQALQLYRVSTIESKQVELILDNKNYQNNQFDLSSDGETIIVQRVNRKNPADFDLWMLQGREKPKRLNTSGGEFLIAPDGKTLAVAQGQGIGILSLQTGAQTSDFLPKFGKILSFSGDGTAAAMVDFNTNNAKLRYQRSLFYVNNQGIQKKLVDVKGSILDCQFTTNNAYLYCLLTELLEGEEYQEKPYFARIAIATSQLTPLAILPDYRDTKLSLAPDGLGILFDRIVTDNSINPNTPLFANSGEPIRDSRLWLLIPPDADTPNDTTPQLKELPMRGFRPQWLP
jgi:hypothetical protein